MTSAKHKNPPAKPKEKYSVQQALTNYYLLIMFTLFPLFFTDAYFNIRHDKYYFFIILTGILVIAEFLIIMTASVDKPEDSKLEKPKPKHLYEELSFIDCIYCILNVTQNVNNQQLDDFLGTQTKYRSCAYGIYTAAYFAITRCFKYFEYIFVALAFGSMIVYALRLTHSILILPDVYSSHRPTDYYRLHFNNRQQNSLFKLHLSLLVMIASYHERPAQAIYLIATGFGFAALMTADSDSGILGMAVYGDYLPCMVFKTVL